MVRAVAAGAPYPVGRILIHSSNPEGALAIRRGLEAAGYAFERHHAPIWRHECYGDLFFTPTSSGSSCAILET